LSEVRPWEVVGLDWHWKSVGPGAAAMPQHEEVCGREPLFVRLSPRSNDEAIVLLTEYKKKKYADKEDGEFKTLGNNRATAYNKDGHTAYLTAKKLGVNVTVLADTGSDYSAISRTAVEDAKKRGFPLKVEVIPEPIMLNMATLLPPVTM
jgi:hypothetical protein